MALIEAAEPICIERFADHPQMGRFTLRDEGTQLLIHISLHCLDKHSSGKTVAIGKVTKLIDTPVDVVDGVANMSLASAPAPNN